MSERKHDSYNVLARDYSLWAKRDDRPVQVTKKWLRGPNQ